MVIPDEIDREIDQYARNIQTAYKNRTDFPDLGVYIDRIFGGDHSDARRDPLLFKCGPASLLVQIVRADGDLFGLCQMLQSKGRWLDCPIDHLPVGRKSFAESPYRNRRANRCTAFEYLCYRIAMFPYHEPHDDSVGRMRIHFQQPNFDRQTLPDSFRSVLQSYLQVLLPHGKEAGRASVVDLELQPYATSFQDVLMSLWIGKSIETLLQTPTVVLQPLKLEEPPHAVLSAIGMLVNHAASDRANAPPRDLPNVQTVRHTVEISPTLRTLRPEIYLLLRAACCNFRMSQTRDWLRLPLYLDIWHAIISPWERIETFSSHNPASPPHTRMSPSGVGGGGYLRGLQQLIAPVSTREAKCLTFHDAWTDYVFHLLPFFTIIMVEFLGTAFILSQPFGVGHDRHNSAIMRIFSVFQDPLLSKTVIEARACVLQDRHNPQANRHRELQAQTGVEAIRICDAHMQQLLGDKIMYFQQTMVLLGSEIDRETECGWRQLVVALSNLRERAAQEALRSRLLTLQSQGAVLPRDSAILQSLPSGTPVKLLDDILRNIGEPALDIAKVQPEDSPLLVGQGLAAVGPRFKSPTRGLNGSFEGKNIPDALLRGTMRCSIADLYKLHAHSFQRIESPGAACASCKQMVTSVGYFCKLCRDDPNRTDSPSARLLPTFEGAAPPELRGLR